MSENAKQFCPLRTIYRLGKHHGSGDYRVAVADDIYTGKTEPEAVTSAVMDILKKNGTTTISITPPL